MFGKEICEMLDITYPIFQGGMAWVADSSLAAGVSNAGGLGIIAAANAPCDVVRQEILKAKELTSHPFGVNIMLMSPSADEIAHLVCELGVKVVTTGAGNPGKYVKMWKEHGIKVIPVVPSSALAVRMERSGADAVIAEGCESGGHVGELTTMALVPQVVDAVGIPVIAAGGIADGRGMCAAYMLGASAVQIGTRFLVADECTVHENYKEKVLGARDTDTIVTGRSTGHPVRVFKNILARKIQKAESDGMTKEEIEALGVGALAKAVRQGDMDNGSVMAGQISGLVNKRQSCKEIIEQLIKEVEEIFSGVKNNF